MYKVLISSKAKKTLSKMDKQEARLLLAWLQKNLEGCADPRRYGKALKGGLRDYWRFRVGNYRILSRLEDDQLKIEVIQFGHRKDIYK